MDLRRIDRIPLVMSLTIRHMRDQAFRFPQFFTDQLHNVDILHLVVAADIIDLTNRAFANDQIDRLAMVFYIQPVPHIQAFPVDRKRLIRQCIGDHQRDQLLRELIGPVIVGAAADRNGQSVCPVIRSHQQIRRGFGTAVGTGGMEWSRLGKEQIRPVDRQVSVYLVGTDLMIPFNTIFAAGIHQNSRTDDICLQEDFRVFNGTVHM